MEKKNTIKEFRNENIDDEISFFEILLFINSSINSIVKSTVICLAIGAAYFFYYPNYYEAKATLLLAKVADIPVETPAILLEKIKLPLFFSSNVSEACFNSEEIDSPSKIADKINPVINRSAPFISFKVKAKNPQEAENCLNDMLVDIVTKQEELAKPILDQKKNELKFLKEKLKFIEQTVQKLSPININALFPNDQFASRALIMSMILTNSKETKDILNEINLIESQLLEPQTKSAHFISPIYTREVTVKKDPVFIILICLMLGILIGLVTTGIKKILPAFSQKIKSVKIVNPTNN